MLAIKKARKLIEADPTTDTSKTLAALVVALETDECFPINDMYKLSDKPFQLALDILAEWRLDRHYAHKVRLIDASTQLHEREGPAQQASAPVVKATKPDDAAPNA